jgi:hypothetical protein
MLGLLNEFSYTLKRQSKLTDQLIPSSPKSDGAAYLHQELVPQNFVLDSDMLAERTIPLLLVM